MIDEEELARLINDPTREERMLRDDGPIVPLILLGFATATTSPTEALLKLEVFVQQANTATILPIRMSRRQCTELSGALERLATMTYQAGRMPN